MRSSSPMRSFCNGFGGGIAFDFQFAPDGVNVNGEAGAENVFGELDVGQTLVFGRFFFAFFQVAHAKQQIGDDFTVQLGQSGRAFEWRPTAVAALAFSRRKIAEKVAQPVFFDVAGWGFGRGFETARIAAFDGFAQGVAD